MTVQWKEIHLYVLNARGGDALTKVTYYSPDQSEVNVKLEPFLTLHYPNLLSTTSTEDFIRYLLRGGWEPFCVNVNFTEPLRIVNSYRKEA